MVLFYNFIFCGYNFIYYQVLLLFDQDKVDFIGYVFVWYCFVKLYYDDEEVFFFIKVEELLQDKMVFEEIYYEYGMFLQLIVVFFLFN